MKGFDAEAARILEAIASTEPHQSAIRLFAAARGVPRTERLLIVPGAFYKEYPRHGADGERLLHAAASLGMTAERVPTPSLCSIERGQELIARAVATTSEPVVIVSLSRGSLDVARCLASGDRRIVRRVAGWISISGIVMGTPLVNLLEGTIVRRRIVRMLLERKGYRYNDLLDLAWRPMNGAGTQAAKDVTNGIPVLHIAGIPSWNQLSSRLARRTARRLRRFGASDGGGVILRDLLRFPGAVVPIAGQDHYLRDVDAADLLRRGIAVIEQLRKSEVPRDAAL